MLGADPAKLRILQELPRIWRSGRRYFDANAAVTGAQLYAYVVGLIEQAGWGHAACHVDSEAFEVGRDEFADALTVGLVDFSELVCHRPAAHRVELELGGQQAPAAVLTEHGIATFDCGGQGRRRT